MDFKNTILQAGSTFKPLVLQSPFQDKREEALRRKWEQLSDEQILGWVVRDKAYFDVHKHFVDKIKHDPESEFISESEIQFAATYLTMDDIMGQRLFKREMMGVAGTNPKLTQMQEHVLTMFFDLGKSSPQEFGSFLHQENIFLGLFFKDNAQNYLSQIGTIYRKKTVHFLALCNLTLQKLEKYPGFQRTISERIDRWLSEQLTPINFKKAVQEENEFAELAFEYLRCAGPDDSAASSVILKKCDVFSPDMQHRMWRAIYTNSSMDKKRVVIDNFISADHNQDTNLRFYTSFVSFLDEQQREQILGVASDQQLQRFARMVKPFTALTEIKIKKPQEKQPTYLVWQLWENGKMPAEEVLKLIDEAHLPDKTEPASRSFLFQDKESFYPDVFVAGCRKMKESPFLLLKWVASFRKCPETKSWIATKWSDLPPQMRQSENMILAIDKHFDLIYQTALRGDTGVLNEIKNYIPKEKLQSRLACFHVGKDTALHALCRQSKKGIVKLLEVFTPDERQALLQLKNDMGQTPMDCCSSDFYRFMTQGNFVRPEQPKQVEEEPKAPVVAELKVPTQKVEMIWRPMVRMSQFEKDLKDLELNPDVIEAAEQEIKDLRSMPAVELHLRMRQDLKPQIKNKPCVADLSVGGTAYRMGYIVKKGVFVPFFLMSHEQYNNELQNTRHMPLLTKLARRQAEEYQKS